VNVTFNNFSDVLDMGSVDLNKVGITPSASIKKIDGVAGIKRFNATGGNVTMSYSINEYGSVIPGNVYIYKCEDFDIKTSICDNNDWTQLSTTRSSFDAINEKYHFTASSSGFSAYVLAEYTPSGYVSDSEETTTSGGGGGGGGGGFKDGIGEELFNETIAKYFSKKEPVSLDITEITRDIFVGENVRGGFKIGNDHNETLTYKVLTSGDISTFMSFEDTSFTIEPSEKADLVYNVVVPETAKPGTFTGDILLRTDNFEKKIPVSLRIDEVKEQKLTLEVVPQSRILIPGRSLFIDVNLYNPAGHDLNMTLLVELYDALTQSVVYNVTENFILDDYYTEGVEFELSKDLRVDKNYVLRAVAEYNVAHQKFDVRSFVNVEVQYPFVLREFEIFGYNVRVWKMLLGMLLTTVLVLCGFVFHSYLEKKKRYHTTVESSQLERPGENSLFVGNLAESHMRTFVGMDKLTTHTIIAGSTGGGKSISAQVIAEEVLEKGRGVIVFDPTAQWSGFLRKLEDEALLRAYSNFDISKSRARSFKGNVHVIKDARQKIDIVKYMKPGEIHVFATNQLDPSDMDMFVASTVSQIFHANLEEARTLKTLVVYDEVHRLLPKFGGSGEGFLQIERACREFRKWGVGIMLISQVLSDFVGQIKANINTEIQVRTKDEGDLERIKMKYGDDFVRGIIKADIGTGLMANAAYNRGRPYFVTFRPIYHSVSRLDDDELEKYSVYNERVEDLEFQMNYLEKNGIDIFDYKLELNLALKKLMVGGFNMVKIYLEGLEPRIKQAFEKNNLEIPKREVELIDEKLIQKSIDAAKKAREKHLKEEKNKKDKDKDDDSEEAVEKEEENTDNDENNSIKDESEENSTTSDDNVTEVKEDNNSIKEPLEDDSDNGEKSPRIKNEEINNKESSKEIKEEKTGSKNSKSGSDDVIKKLKNTVIEVSELLDKIEKTNGSMRLERSRLKVISKDINLCEHGLGDVNKISQKLNKFLEDVQSEYR
ncbi:hypothetical protein BVX95_01015, partial [archaeon D22]